MKNIILATHNAHKVEEMSAILGDAFNIESLDDLEFTQEIPETGLTFQANAKQKATFVYQQFQRDCMADDTGLEVEALHGEPGVYSARYAGEPANSENNIAKLLSELKGKTNRKAQFRTVIALIYDNKTYFFEGSISGEITESPRGTNGFGYDSIFMPEGYEQTFGELDAEIKNTISHRGRAIEKLVKFINEKQT